MGTLGGAGGRIARFFGGGSFVGGLGLELGRQNGNGSRHECHKSEFQDRVSHLFSVRCD
jgi:hypothetical protein